MLRNKLVLAVLLGVATWTGCPGHVTAGEQVLTAEPGSELREIFDALKDVGSPAKAKREAALDKAAEFGPKAVPVLLAFMNPKQKMDADSRLGAARALAKLGPLDKQAALALAFIAMRDPDNEVRREAARSIKALKEDRAVEYILHAAVSEEKSTQFAAARALRELNDDRAYAALASTVTPPNVQGNNFTPPSYRTMSLPTGPLGAEMPVFMPEGSVAGMSTNLTSPPADALKLISGKDLGNVPFVWIAWLREKTGLLTKEDLEKYFTSKSSLKSRMGGTPP